MASEIQEVLQAQIAHASQLMAKSNVVGVAVGYKESKGKVTDQLAVVTLVEQKKPLAALSADDMIPDEVGGVRTDVYEIGYVRALQTPRDRYRPVIPNGISIGHYKITAGTLGTIVTDRNTGEKLILSNNHVLANSNDSLVGDAILQPAAMDGGQNPGDMVARLLRFVPLYYIGDPDPTPLPPDPDPDPTPDPTPNPNPSPTPDPGTTPSCDIVDVIVKLANAIASMSGSEKRVQVQSPTVVQAAQTPISAQTVDNLVDCAVARPLNPDIFTDSLSNIGQVNGTKPPALGMRVRKEGRTTGYTEGTITLLNATVNVAYSTTSGNRTARFTGQVITESMSQGGDSGSLIVDQAENKAVGLLFAGSSVATIFTPIDLVLNALNVNI